MSLYDLLACPICKVRVLRQGNKLFCKKCHQSYPIINDVPVMLPDGRIPNVQHEADLVTHTDIYPWFYRVIIQSLLDNHIILCMGSGNLAIDDPCLIRLDIAITPHVDIVADAHHLPFLPESIDFIFSLAVLEHLRQPFEAAQSIFEVLKDGGYIYHECNFVFAYHGYPHHYFNASLQGLEQIFSQFKHLRKGVAPYQMPSFALQMFLKTYLKHFRVDNNDAGRQWVLLLENILKQNLMWNDNFFKEEGALNVAAGTYIAGIKQNHPKSTIIPQVIEKIWTDNFELQKHYPNFNNLTTINNILIWAKNEGRRKYQDIDKYFKELIPFNKRGPVYNTDSSHYFKKWTLQYLIKNQLVKT